MLHLLTDTSLFLSLPNGCFCQVTGEPIIHMIPGISQVEDGRLQNQNDIPAIVSQKRPLPNVPGQNNKARKRRKLNPTHGGQTSHSSTAPGVSEYVVNFDRERCAKADILQAISGRRNLSQSETFLRSTKLHAAHQANRCWSSRQTWAS